MVVNMVHGEYGGAYDGEQDKEYGGEYDGEYGSKYDDEYGGEYDGEYGDEKRDICICVNLKRLKGLFVYKLHNINHVGGLIKNTHSNMNYALLLQVKQQKQQPQEQSVAWAVAVARGGGGGRGREGGPRGQGHRGLCKNENKIRTYYYKVTFSFK